MALPVAVTVTVPIPMPVSVAAVAAAVVGNVVVQVVVNGEALKGRKGFFKCFVGSWH